MPQGYGGAGGASDNEGQNHLEVRYFGLFTALS